MHRFLPIGILLSLITLASLEPLGSQTIDSLAFKDLQFRMAGPFRGGRSSAVTGFPADLDRWLMGTTGGGVWETTDNGISWHNISDGFFGGSIGAVRVAAVSYTHLTLPTNREV